VTSVHVTARGIAVDGAAPSWGRFADERDPLVASARAFVGARNERLPRLGRSTLSALVAVHLVLEGGGAPAALIVSVDDGSAAADRAFWATAGDRGGAGASPTLFAATLPSAVAGELAATFAFRGPCIVVAGAGASDGPRVRAGGGDDGRCLHVRLSDWDAGPDGEAFAVLERGI
jgi:hypothetical protein